MIYFDKIEVGCCLDSQEEVGRSSRVHSPCTARLSSQCVLESAREQSGGVFVSALLLALPHVGQCQQEGCVPPRTAAKAVLGAPWLLYPLAGDQVVNRLLKDHVYSTILQYGVNYDKTWIYDKIHHEINQFCSAHRYTGCIAVLACHSTVVLVPWNSIRNLRLPASIRP